MHVYEIKMKICREAIAEIPRPNSRPTQTTDENLPHKQIQTAYPNYYIEPC